MIGRDPPSDTELDPIPNGKNGIGIAAVDGQKHGITF
jgi:hypothetical protein